jgi:hypothetical protein
MNLHNFLKWLQAKLGGKAMPNLKKPEIAEIKVIVTPEHGNPSNMKFSFPTKTTGKVKHWKENSDDMWHVRFENQGAGGFLVLFNIEDDNGTGCRFHDDPAEAMYCHDQRSCPTGPSRWEQFAPVGVINDGRTLIVFNRNNPAHDFGFTLRFTTDFGPREFDPIGEDANG